MSRKLFSLAATLLSIMAVAENRSVSSPDGRLVVTINDDGVTVYDKDGNVKKNAGKHYDKTMAVIGAVEGALTLIAVAGYLLLGLLLGFWASGWIVFFLPEVICSIARAIYKKDARKVNIPFAAAFAFFFVCMVFPGMEANLWHPMWVIFLTIPVYYIVVSAIRKALGKDPVDDDEDDED
jgi:hypothetical protein